jgi:hypothetical protein
MPDQPETPLEMAERFIAEGEAQCTQVTQLLEAGENHSLSPAKDQADRLLLVLDRSLALLREYLETEKNEQQRPAADDAGA